MLDPILTQPLILAIDIGTSSVRAALYDHDANVLPRTMVKNERLLEVTDEGGAEIDAELAFKQVVAAIDDTLKKAGAVKGTVTHVVTSCFWHSLVGINANGRPKTKVLGWADTRSREQVAILRKTLNESEIHNRTGARFHSSYWPSKLLWLRKEFGSDFRSTSKWISLSDYVLFRLTGEMVTSISMASGTGIFDQRSCQWDPGLIRFLKLSDATLPAVADEGRTFRIKSDLARRWPRLREAEWFPAIGDGAANNIGADCVTRSRAALMIGTSGAMRVAYEGDPPDEIPSGLWCYRIDRNYVVIGGAISDGGGLYRWLKDNIRLDLSDDELDNEIVRRKPAGHGLTFLPFLAGERSTGYHENALGSVHGLRSSTDPIDILQAALESVAYRFADIFDQLKTVVRIREIVASGGALRESPVWTQMIADVLQNDLTLPETREASSRGAVLHALDVLGRHTRSGKADSLHGKKFKANKKRSIEYKTARRHHTDFYKKIIDS